MHRVCIDPLRFSHNTLLASQQEAYGTTSAQLATRAYVTYQISDPRFKIETFSLFKQIVCRNGTTQMEDPQLKQSLQHSFLGDTSKYPEFKVH